MEESVYKYAIHYSNGSVIPANMPDHISSMQEWENYYTGVTFSDNDGKLYYVVAITSNRR